MGFKYELIVDIKEISKKLNYIASRRIEHFKDFPYLYSGKVEYEEKYLAEFFSVRGSVLIICKDESNVVAFGTATPMNKSMGILSDCYKYLEDNHHDPEKYFYISEIIIEKSHRQLGILKEILRQIQKYSIENKYKHTCFLTVKREKNHPLIPPEYFPHDTIFLNTGYKKTNLVINFEWPTFISKNEIIDCMNPMSFWIKEN